MLKLQSIYLRNWCKTAEAQLAFPASGYVLVRGQNETAPGQVDSSGSGKTALGEAINRTFLGASLTAQLGDYSRDWIGNTYVNAYATLHGKSLRVEMGYKCPEMDSDGEGLRFTYDGAPPVERPRAAQTRAELSSLIGVSPEVSLWTTFIDGERLKFNRLSQNDALDLLMQALNQPPWTQYLAKAKEALEARSSSAQRFSTLLEQLKTGVEAATMAVKTANESAEQEAAHYQRLYLDYEARMKQYREKIQVAADTLAKASAECDRIKKDIKKAEAADAEEFGRLELKATRLRGEQRTTQSYLNGWNTHLAQVEAKLDHAEKELSALLSGKSCPTCHRAVGEKASPETLKAMEKQSAQWKKKLAESQQNCANCEKDLAEIDAELAEVEKDGAKLRAARISPLSHELEKAETALHRADRDLRNLEREAPVVPDDRATQRAQTVLAERRVRQAELEAAVAEKAQSLAEAEHQLRIASYWVKGFSPAGIPNIVLRQTIGPLNETARLISEALSGGVIRVRFAADIERASGAVVPKLVTEVETHHGAGKLSRNSKGELGRANLIIAETQTQVGRILQRVGYRWFDEAVNAQDPVVRRNIYSFLRQQAHERNVLTFVVDHHEEAAVCADHILVAHKAPDGLTTYRWE